MGKIDKETHAKIIRIAELFKEHTELFKKIGPYRRYEIFSAIEDARHPKKTMGGKDDDDYHSFNYRDKSHCKVGALRHKVDPKVVIDFYDALYKDVNVITALIQEAAAAQSKFNSKPTLVTKAPVNPIQEFIFANKDFTYPNPHIYGIFRPLFKGQASKKQYETVRYIDQEFVKRFNFESFQPNAYVVPCVQYNSDGELITSLEDMQPSLGFPLGTIVSSDPETGLIDVRVTNQHNVGTVVHLPQELVMPLFSLSFDQVPSIKSNQTCIAILPGTDFFYVAKSPNYKKGENLYRIVFNAFPGEYNLSPEAVTFIWSPLQELWKNDPKKK